MAVLIVENLRKSYGTTTAVDDVSLNVAAGQIYGLLGPNGAGKTTTLRCIATLTKPDAGTIQVYGATDARAIRQNLGYIAQEVALDKVLTGRELLELQAALYHMPSKTIKTRINEVLELLQLQEYADKLTGTYSGGLKKRLDLAAGLLHQPKILILDEPTVGLDIQTRITIWNFLRQLKSEGITVLITSHYLEEIDALAERVAIIDKGKVIAEGTPSDLKSQLGGDRLTIKIKEFAEYPEAEQALKQLKNLPFVTSGLINNAQGNAINLVIAPDPKAVAEIQSCLDTANIPIFSFSQSKPSLDDVFLSATGQTILDAEIAQAEITPTKKRR
ncbi:daunorubicin resistance ABC transporter ATP-binding subunit [Synechococcus sp. PCC 7502]|uniref:daunorubicin resistance protein DrrA family ABC transporter ATP-binding protein n=1 Tax=Synechococcus sp. PCC 7502 TaxID=1173263 RepID=UPI00029FEE44|nr:daunorubicin resistance protein DrrA family ABC transporter ATP-binding protein [Synechococcus sp. PCC 7502]AFY74626.1 daunorubicin resistance ABC transporter ATP-binding subunit [Synechococcus sp. PCC 7502]